MEFLDALRGFGIVQLIVRLTLAVLFGGIIGLDRENKQRPAGFRTYMLVCLGAALTVMLGEYEHEASLTIWAGTGIKADVGRLGAQVINGIGFLGSGTILLTGQRGVKGLTTAACLWASACMGLAIGAGFYECVVIGFAAILFCIKIFQFVDAIARASSRHLDLRVRFDSLSDFRAFLLCIKSMNIRILNIEIEKRGTGAKSAHTADFFLYIPSRSSCDTLIEQLSALNGVRDINVI